MNTITLFWRRTLINVKESIRRPVDSTEVCDITSLASSFMRKVKFNIPKRLI